MDLSEIELQGSIYTTKESMGLSLRVIAPSGVDFCLPFF